MFAITAADGSAFTFVDAVHSLQILGTLEADEGGSLTIAANGGVAGTTLGGTNFFGTVIVGRWCGLNELGLYSLAFGVMILISVLQQSLILNPYAVFSNRLAGRRGSILGSPE